MDDLDKLILNLEKFAKDPLSLIEDEIQEVFAEAMAEIVKRTIYDTNTSRKILLKAMKETFGVDRYSLLEQPINYWNTGEQPSSYSVAEVITTLTREYYFEFNADGLAGQEYNDDPQHNYPSQNPVLVAIRGNEFFPHHISYTCDEINSKNNQVINKIIEKMIKKIVTKLQGGLLNG